MCQHRIDGEFDPNMRIEIHKDRCHESAEAIEDGEHYDQCCNSDGHSNDRNKGNQSDNPNLAFGDEIADAMARSKAHEPNLIIRIGSRRAAIREGMIEDKKHIRRAKRLTRRKLRAFRSIGTWVIK